MSEPLTWQTITWPREVETTQLLAALLAMSGLSAPNRRGGLILQAIGTKDGVSYQVGISGRLAGALTRQLRTAIPGLSLEAIEPDQVVPRVDRAWRAWQSTAARSLRTDDPEIISRGLITALSAPQGNELLLARWRLGPVRRPRAIGGQIDGNHEGSPISVLLKAALGQPADLDAESRRALRMKRALPGWRAALETGVRAEGVPRQRQLLGQLAAAFRVGQGPGVELGFTGIRPHVVSRLRRVWRWRLDINVGELLGLSTLPLGITEHLPVARVRSRLLPPPRALASQGHVIGEATFPGAERQVAISVADALMHTHLIGVTGAGKSTLIVRNVVNDLIAGRAVAVIEPKGDLIDEILQRVPENRIDDVVLIDPADDSPVGLNPLVQPGVPGELIVDQILAVFKGLFGDAIGPRTQDLLTAGLLTLVGRPGMSLVALPLLFTDAAFRHRLVAGIDDPLVLAPFWAWYENLSPGERSAVIAPLMNKLRSFLLRPRLRRVISQPAPRFDLNELFTRRRIVLFQLRKGILGPEATQLLGSLAFSMLWQATLGRSAIPAERRHPTFIYVDEVQDFLHLPQDFSDVLAQARGLGVGMIVAHQHLGQLTPSVRAATLANARSRVIFTVSHDDAVQLIWNDSRLVPADLASLRAHEAYASLLAGNEPQPFVSVRTQPLPPPTTDPDVVRERSRSQWGIAAGAVDAALEAMISGRGSTTATSDGESDSFGIRRRKQPPSEEPEAKP